MVNKIDDGSGVLDFDDFLLVIIFDDFQQNLLPLCVHSAASQANQNLPTKRILTRIDHIIGSQNTLRPPVQNIATFEMIRYEQSGKLKAINLGDLKIHLGK